MEHPNTTVSYQFPQKTLLTLWLGSSLQVILGVLLKMRNIAENSVEKS
jgi:hypothetical protein